ncbi:molybdopterin molybdotransferase MoeA, partial [Sinomicrobium weinanense]
MIPVTEARKIIKEHTFTLPPVTLNIAKAIGHVLAEDVYASCDIPPFHQSAMDGYAFVFADWKNKGSLLINGEVPAGTESNVSLSPGKAVRIFTGAAVPEGADTVVMQEKVNREGEQLFIEDELLEEGKNIRRRGTEIRKGDLALPGGTTLTPAGVGFLSGVGIAKVRVYPRPSVAVIVTGNELQSPGEPLQHGQIYESNSFMLRSALLEMGVENIMVDGAKDNLDELTAVLRKTLNHNDVVLLTGGVSVGDYDFVVEASGNCGVQTLFHRLKQRPGKPLYFGKKEGKLVFGLPG